MLALRSFITVLQALCLIIAGMPDDGQASVMARHAPERKDDFIFENDLVCGRFYGQKLEKQMVTPGIDIFVKLPGALMMDEWYSHIKDERGYYHKDHGGKDCYVVGVTLGGGASSPFIDGKLCFPATNYRSYEILENKPDCVVFVLHYPEWEAAPGIKVSLDKKITVTPGTYFLKCEDSYSFSGCERLCIAAGVFRHPDKEVLRDEFVLNDRYAIWENATDIHAEPEEGLIGVAVVMPGAERCFCAEDGVHGLCAREIVSGETLTYYFGSCWSKGDLKTPGAWFQTVALQ